MVASFAQLPPRCGSNVTAQLPPPNVAFEPNCCIYESDDTRQEHMNGSSEQDAAGLPAMMSCFNESKQNKTIIASGAATTS